MGNRTILQNHKLSRRDFVKHSAVSLAILSVAGGRLYAGGSGTIKVGLIGCGERGTGAATQVLLSTKTPGMSDMEWQCRNWFYTTWLSGDHICEQHVHNLDIMNWGIGEHPVQVIGIGGRQSRTGPEYGNIFDHFACEFEYPDGDLPLDPVEIPGKTQLI